MISSCSWEEVYVVRTIETDVGHDVKRPRKVHVMLMAKFIANFSMNKPKVDVKWKGLLNGRQYRVGLQGDVIDW